MEAQAEPADDEIAIYDDASAVLPWPERAKKWLDRLFSTRLEKSDRRVRLVAVGFAVVYSRHRRQARLSRLQAGAGEHARRRRRSQRRRAA